MNYKKSETHYWNKLKVIFSLFIVIFFIHNSCFAQNFEWAKNYDEVGATWSEFIVVKKNNLYGAVDKNGEIKIPLIYENKFTQFPPFIVQKEGKFGLVDRENKTLIPFEYDDIKKDKLNEDVKYRIKQNGLWGVIDNDFNLILPPKYEDIELNPFQANKNYAIVAKDFYWGLIDRNEKFIIPAEYESVTLFDENGLASIKKDGKWGKIDSDGNIKLKPTYPNLTSLKGYKSGNNPPKNPYYIVFDSQGKAGVLNPGLQSIIPVKYDKIESLSDDFLLVVNKDLYDEKCGVYSFAGNKVFLAPKFKKKDIEQHDDFVYVFESGAPSVYNKDGKMIIPKNKYLLGDLVENKFFEAKVRSGSGGWGEITASGTNKSKDEEVVLDVNGDVIFSSKSGVKNKTAYNEYQQLKNK